MFLPIQRVHLLRKEAKSTKFWSKRAKLTAFAGHSGPAGRMLCMPGISHAFAVRQKKNSFVAKIPIVKALILG